jgi:phosphatidate cytidylyltransferase
MAAGAPRRARREPPEQRPGRRPPPGSGHGDLSARILAAIPVALFAVVIVAADGVWFALGALLFGLVAMHELYVLMGRVRPVKLAGFLTLVALVLAALLGDHLHVMIVLCASFPLVFALALVRPRRANVAWAIAATFLGILWIGLPLVHAIFLRELPHGAGLLADVLIGTFVGDTAAYSGGRTWGRRPLAPGISPNKTLEGLVAGIVAGTFFFWLFAFAYQDWFRPAWTAVVVGLCVALAAPIGDLFESLVKRDLGVKDAGRVLGPHGGVLDRLDGVFFTVVAGYYAVLAVVPFAHA